MNERQFWREVLDALGATGDVKNEHAFRRSFIKALTALTSTFSNPITPLARIKTISSGPYTIMDNEADIFMVDVSGGGYDILLDDGIAIGRSFIIHRKDAEDVEVVDVIIPVPQPPGYVEYPLTTVTTLRLTKTSNDWYIIENS